jgi:type I restriction enzyme S subunit
VRAPVGTVAKSIHNACIGRGMSAIQAIHDNYQEFIYQWLLYFEPFWSDISQGGTFDAVNSDDIRKLLVPIPEKEEQKKIADCLFSLDELIAAHTQKHQELQSYKKGLLQNLFPAEGETVPKLRFPEFEDAGDWVEAPLENVARYENGKAHEQGITKSGDFVVVNSKFISTDGEVKKYTGEAFCLAKKGDILMVLSDVPNGRAIAKCFFVDENNRYTVNQRICKLSPKKAVGIMLFYSLNRNPYFLSFDDGVKQTNLRKDDVLNCPLLLPKDFEEQQKIADCLCSVDDLIYSQAQKIEELIAHKKGLTQQLFPAVNEVGA